MPSLDFKDDASLQSFLCHVLELDCLSDLRKSLPSRTRAALREGNLSPDLVQHLCDSLRHTFDPSLRPTYHTDNKPSSFPNALTPNTFAKIQALCPNLLEHDDFKTHKLNQRMRLIPALKRDLDKAIRLGKVSPKRISLWLNRSIYDFFSLETCLENIVHYPVEPQHTVEVRWRLHPDVLKIFDLASQHFVSIGAQHMADKNIFINNIVDIALGKVIPRTQRSTA